MAGPPPGGDQDHHVGGPQDGQEAPCPLLPTGAEYLPLHSVFVSRGHHQANPPCESSWSGGNRVCVFAPMDPSGEDEKGVLEER